ncbi:hypothetical protein JKY72_06090 [Candidatus Gracilibacteria bacterium]|nr:hypothetical protein [Candidatus Gracilibacteria bacterium]
MKVIGLDVRHSPKPVEISYNEKVDVSVKDGVIFKDDDGKEEYGVIAYINKDPRDADTVMARGKILRMSTDNDLQKLEKFGDDGQEASLKCKALVAKHALEMRVFAGVYSFDGLRLYFLFTAEARVDFRDLVKDLASTFRKQIHLRQIGPRDRAKMIGGYGKCGRELCCSSFLGKLESINMEMVRVQGLESKGSSKLSGACGKLLCCLKYEVEAYKSLRKAMPRMGDMVKVPAEGKDGKVIALDVLNQKMKLYFPESKDTMIVGAADIKKL